MINGLKSWSQVSWQMSSPREILKLPVLSQVHIRIPRGNFYKVQVSGHPLRLWGGPRITALYNTLRWVHSAARGEPTASQMWIDDPQRTRMRAGQQQEGWSETQNEEDKLKRLQAPLGWMKQVRHTHPCIFTMCESQRVWQTGSSYSKGLPNSSCYCHQGNKR